MRISKRFVDNLEALACNEKFTVGERFAVSALLGKLGCAVSAKFVKNLVALSCDERFSGPERIAVSKLVVQFYTTVAASPDNKFGTIESIKLDQLADKLE